MDHLQNLIKEYAFKVYTQLKKKEICMSNRLFMLHYLSGTKEDPFGLRKSEIISEDSFLNQTSEGFSEEHEKVQETFRSFIRFFGENRRKTMLSYALDNLTVINDGFNIRFIVSDDVVEKYTIPMNLKKVEKYKSNKNNISKPIKNSFTNNYEILIPKKLEYALFPVDQETVINFSNQLHQKWDEDKMNLWKEFFEFSRDEMLSIDFLDEKDIIGTIKKGNGEIVALDQIEKSVINKRRLQKQLSIYQAGIFYFFNSINDEPLQHKVCDLYVIPIEIGHPVTGNTIENITLVFVLNHQYDLDKDKLMVEINSNLSDFKEKLKELIWVDNSNTLVEKLNKILKVVPTEEEATLHITDNEELNLKKWITYYSYIDTILPWHMVILSKLCNKVHEGRKLDFYFLLADISEINDNKNFEILPFEEEDANALEIPIIYRDPYYNLNNKINNTVELLAKEHYPWFENGRFAIVWDIVSQSFRPFGLVKLVNNNWKSVVNYYLQGKNDINLDVDLVLLSSIGEVSLTNVLRLEKRPQTKRSIAEIIRYNEPDNTWIINVDNNREKVMHTFLKEIINKRLNGDYPDYEREKVLEKEINKLLEVSELISKHPEKGGIIVLAEDINADHFHSLGEPWKIESDSTDNLVALISHDGASIKYFNKNVWFYRKIFNNVQGMPTNIGSTLSLITELNYKYQKYKNYDFCPLSLVGSRRWGSAKLSFHKDILSVVTISQDGDLMIWGYYHNEEFSESELILINAFLQFEISTFNIDLDDPHENEERLSKCIAELKHNLEKDSENSFLDYTKKLDVTTDYDEKKITIDKIGVVKDHLVKRIKVLTLTKDGKILLWDMSLHENLKINKKIPTIFSASDYEVKKLITDYINLN